MHKFYCTFYNKDNLGLTIYFFNTNWHSVEEVAVEALLKQPEHFKYGPWCIGTIDITA